jgi:hypothetical protein
MRVLLIGVVVFLTSCAAQVLSSNPRSVTVKAGQVRIVDAQTLADTECAKHKRFARLALRPTDNTPNHWVFDCVD